MYFLDARISKNFHISDNVTIKGKTWEDFEIACKGKKLILYGITDLTNIFYLRCNGQICIVAAIDNDEEKQGYKLSDYFDFDNENLKMSNDIVIESEQALLDYDPNEIVILISSLRYYEEIALNLDKNHFHNYFSVLNLEGYYREKLRASNIPFKTEEDYIFDYQKKCMEIYPIKGNKILFCSMGMYSDHCKYITECLLNMHLDLEIVWIMNNLSTEVPDGVRIVYEGKWQQYIYEMTTAKIWVYGIEFKMPFIKRDGQIYIQTKHWGSLTLKKFYLDDVANESKRRVYDLNAKYMDYIITGSEFDENSCRRGFGFNISFLRFGSPRSDALFKKKEMKLKVYKKFHLTSDEKILLYAPTYRSRDGKGSSPVLKWMSLNFEILLNSLKQKWGGKWKIFLRLHPLVKTRRKNIELPDYVVDASLYEDSQELVAASEIVITDFSSIVFEPAYVFKPVFLYSPDKAYYEEKNFGLLIEYDELPFSISTSNEELSYNIKNFDENKYKQNVRAFLDKYDVHEDGHASERAAKFIVDLIEK